MEQDFERQLAKINKVDELAQHEQRILDEVIEERKITLSTLVGEAWMAKAFPDKYASHLDPLLTKKFRTKAGQSSIRLEKLLLELDKVDTLGNETLRTKRKEEVRYLQHLLKRADELNAKANRLVDFQEQLASEGRTALRRTFEASENAKSDPVQESTSTASSQGERKFAGEVSETTEDDKAERVGPSELTNPVSDEKPIETDSVEDVQARSHEHEEVARRFYEKQNGSIPNHHSQVQESHPAKLTRVSRISSPEFLEEPEIQINEMPRAYVIVIEDPKVKRSKVNLERGGALVIAIPGRKPLRYDLGANINLHGITKEIQGNFMKLVLPKVSAMPMRTGRSLTDVPAYARGWGGNDFWSRF